MTSNSITLPTAGPDPINGEPYLKILEGRKAEGVEKDPALEYDKVERGHHQLQRQDVREDLQQQQQKKKSTTMPRKKNRKRRKNTVMNH